MLVPVVVCVEVKDDGGDTTTEVWLLLSLDWLFELSTPGAVEYSTRLDTKEPIDEGLDGKNAEVVWVGDRTELVDEVPDCELVMKLPNVELEEPLNELEPDADPKLLVEAVRDLLLEAELVRLDEGTEPIDENSELREVMLEIPELDNAFDELGVELDAVEFNAAALDAAEVGMAEEDVFRNDGNVEDVLEVAAWLAERVEDETDDVVAFASDEDTLGAVVKLANRLDAEDNDGLGASGDTPTLSALMISAACQTYQLAPWRIYFVNVTFSATA
ncbi:MAG: hypothetical protein Q9200_005668 [Gallowayella weberi]